MFEDVKVGDRVTRILAGYPMQLTVTRVTDTLIIAGNDFVPGGDETKHTGWWFDRQTGAEVDEELGWGPRFGRTGSYLVKETT